MHRFIWLAIATCIIGLPGAGFRTALAGEQIRTLVASGDWIAQERRASMTATPDLCSAFTTGSNQAFAPLKVSSNTTDAVTAVTTREDFDSMLAAMEKAGSLTIKAGVAPPRTVSLHGSNKAMEALLTCAGTIPKGEGGHSNPR